MSSISESIVSRDINLTDICSNQTMCKILNSFWVSLSKADIGKPRFNKRGWPGYLEVWKPCQEIEWKDLRCFTWRRNIGETCFEYLESCHGKDTLESFCASPKERIWKLQGNRSYFIIRKEFLTDPSKLINLFCKEGRHFITFNC